MSQGIQFKALPFTLRSKPGSEDDRGSICGLASAFFTIDDSWWNDIIAPGCFRQDLPAFLRSGFVGGLNHNWDQPIGKPTRAEETAEGLYVEAALSDTTAAREARILMRDGVITRLSIGFRVLARQVLETGDEVAAWWRSVGYSPTPEDLAKSRDGARLLTRVRLYEFSPVAVPANPGAVITDVRSAAPRMPGWAGAEPDEVRPECFRGGPFAAHSDAVLAAVEEYADRLRSLRELRSAKGRAVSPEHLVGFRRLRAELESAIEEMTAARPDQESEASRARTDFERAIARLNGVEA